MNIEDYKADINDICQLYGVKRLELFGSILRSDFSKNSDIDIFYEFSGPDDLFLRFMGLKNDLENLFQRKVDLIREDKITNQYILKNIQNSKRMLIYAA